MKRGFRGVPGPLLPAMLPVVDQSTGPADQAEDQPSSFEPLPSTSHPTPRQDLVPTLITKVDSLETELKQTKQTMEKAIVKLVKKVKKLENILKRRNVVLTTSEDEEPEDHERIFKDINDDPLVSFVTPTKPSGEAPEEEISPTTLEAAKTMSKVASQRSKSVDKGKRYKRRKEFKGKDFEDISIGFEKVNTGGLGVSTSSGPVSSARGQREGKAPMIVEKTQAPKRTKEKIQQEEASLAEAIRLQTLEEEETAKQVHLDALLAKRIEEKELTEQQKQRRAQVQFEAQHYTEEDLDAIRAKLEANAELIKNVLGKELPEEDFAKKMVELVNQRKKFFAEERAKAIRSKPMTQSLLRNYMLNYLKNQGTWKLTQLKKLSFEEVKEEFDKLVKQVESFVPMNIEATKAQLKRYGEKLQTKISKKQRIDDKDVSFEEKVTEVKEEEPVIITGKRKKQKARKGINVYKSPQGDSETDKEESIIRANGADAVYMSFGAMRKDFTREDLIKLYRTMFDPPLNEDAIWSLPLQQKIINRKYPLSKDACQVMLKMKLLDGKMNEVCYKLLKMIEKQAGSHQGDVMISPKDCSPRAIGYCYLLSYKRLNRSKTLDLRTEFKNRVINQFCEIKGIKRELSVARTPQQNGVAGRKNKTLLEAARTMLGRKPALSFMRPFGYPVTILNTIDHLADDEDVGSKKDERGSCDKEQSKNGCSGYITEEGIDYDEMRCQEYVCVYFMVRYEEGSLCLSTTSDLKSDFPEEFYKSEMALYGLSSSSQEVGMRPCPTYLFENRFQRGRLDKTLVLIKRDQGEYSIVQDATGKRRRWELFISQDKYLKGQPKLGLWYPKDSPFDLVAYTDSDYAGASLDRKSTTGGCQFLGCRLISWQCKKQTVVANSTTEAEYVAASSCCGQVLWIQNQLLDYGYNFMHTKIYIDNESTICIVKNPVFHSKTKHIEIRHHFIRDSNEKKLIQMIKIHTDKNVADLLTKAFDKGIGVNAGDSKLMLLGINLLLLEKVNAARHKLTAARES
ncbi:putative ribonuclease H-like domain-containing protein [Tanacetum coccineum]